MNKSGKKSDDQHNKSQQESPEFEHTGQYLNKIRSDKGLTTKDVCEATRISEVNLDAIETQDIQNLPAETFTRGLLTIYAKFMDIDPDKTVRNFMDEFNAKKYGSKSPKTKATRELLAPKPLAEPSQISSMTTACILLVMIVVLFTAFCFFTSWNPFSFLADRKNDSHSIMMSAFTENHYNTDSHAVMDNDSATR